jgi:hypothetical protein
LKTVFIISFVFVLVLGLFSAQAFGQAINFKGLHHPGLKWAWKFNADNYIFIVNTTSNFDMQNVTFNKDTKTLTFLGNSSHTDNISEIEIPSNLIGGNYTVYQNGAQISPIVLKNGNLTTVILKFNDTGKTVTNVIGTTYLPEFAGIVPLIMIISFVALLLTFRYRKI